MPLPASRDHRGEAGGPDARVGFVESVDFEVDVGPKDADGRRNPCRCRRAQASEFDGIGERNHWMT